MMTLEIKYSRIDEVIYGIMEFMPMLWMEFISPAVKSAGSNIQIKTFYVELFFAPFT